MDLRVKLTNLQTGLQLLDLWKKVFSQVYIFNVCFVLYAIPLEKHEKSEIDTKFFPHSSTDSLFCERPITGFVRPITGFVMGKVTGFVRPITGFVMGKVHLNTYASYCKNKQLKCTLSITFMNYRSYIL